jgi:hypothetical protein
MAQPQLARGEMVQLLEDINGATGIWIPFVLCTFGFAVGLVVLPAACARRMRSTRPWRPAVRSAVCCRGSGAGRNGVRHAAVLCVRG